MSIDPLVKSSAAALTRNAPAPRAAALVTAAVTGGGLGIALAALLGMTPAWPWAIATALLGALWAWRGGRPWPWAWGYLALWPWPDGRVAVTALAAAVTGTALLTPAVRAWLTPARVALGLAVAAFALYVATLAPGLLPAPIAMDRP